MAADETSNYCPAPARERSGISAWWLAGGVALVLLVANARSKRLEVEAAANAKATPADLLRALVVTTTRANRAAVLKRYQRAEGIDASGVWNAATAAAAETRLSDFTADARATLNRVIEQDPFFRAK